MTDIDTQLQKALEFGLTEASPIIPEVVEAGIRRFVETDSPLYNITPQTPITTDTYSYRALTELPSAAFTAEGKVAGNSKSTYQKETAQVKFLTTRGEVTGPAIAAATSPIDVWREEIANHSDALIRMLERNMLTGDSADPLQFDGFLKQIAQEIDAEDEKALSLGMLDEAMDMPRRVPTHIIVNREVGRRVWALLQAQQRFNDRVDVAGGFRVPSYNDRPIIRIDNEAADDLSNTVLLPDMNHATLAVLKGLTFENIGKVEDTEAFFIKMYCVLAVEGVNMYHSKIVNLKSA